MKHTIYGILKTWSSNKNRHLIDKLILKGNVTGTEVLDMLKGMAPTLNIPPDKDTPLHILEQILGDEDINMRKNVGRNY
jgi:hypothetical protein